MDADLYKGNDNLIILMHRKFNDDIFVRFLFIMKNYVISFVTEYRGSTLRPPF